MKNKNTSALVKCVALVLAAAIPFVMALTFMLATRSVYSKTFLGELSYKVKRLDSVEEPKVVVVGGSSVAFGLNTPLLEEMTGMKVVNFGLYATLGTKLMLDLSRHSVGEGDVVVIAPELDPQTLSLYFNAEATWQGIDSNIFMLRYIGTDNYTDMIGGAADYISDKIHYRLHGAPNPDGVYNFASFDVFGDIYYPRPYNVMTYWYDISQQLTFDPSMYSADFLAYLNDYIAFCEKQGAKVCYSFPPMNASAVAAGTDEETYANLYSFLCENLDCEVIGSPENYVMDAQYFYDSNFHPNAAGAKHHTAHLGYDLRRFLGLTEIVSVELPEPEERPADFGQKENGNENENSGTESGWSALFTYAERLNPAGELIGYTVTGLADEAKGMTTLEIPQSYRGKPVLEIGESAFAQSSSLRSLTIRDNIIAIATGAFADCPTLNVLSIYNENSSTMIVDQTELFRGASSNITILLHSESSYESYVTGYFWANYGSMMKLDK